MLTLQGIAKTYQGRSVLRPTDLEIVSGRTTVLIGPSGSGKSTLLRIMIGLIEPDNGAVRFDGTVLDPGNVSLMRRRMGYVIQNGGLFPHLTARGNVTLMSAPTLNARSPAPVISTTRTARFFPSSATLFDLIEQRHRNGVQLVGAIEHDGRNNILNARENV